MAWRTRTRRKTLNSTQVSTIRVRPEHDERSPRRHRERERRCDDVDAVAQSVVVGEGNQKLTVLLALTPRRYTPIRQRRGPDPAAAIHSREKTLLEQGEVSVVHRFAANHRLGCPGRAGQCQQQGKS